MKHITRKNEGYKLSLNSANKHYYNLLHNFHAYS